MPQRIQRRRTKGWTMPDGAVYVGRPTKWGNPFVVGMGETREDSCRQFRAALVAAIAANDAAIVRDVMELRGKDLACWCPLDEACHADVLLELANSDQA